MTSPATLRCPPMLPTAGLHEERGDPDSPSSASEPIEFSRDECGSGYQQRFNRVTGRVGVGAENEDYDDVTSITGGTLDQDDRDNWAYFATGQIGYDLYPGYQPFLRFTYTRTEYDEGIVKPDSDTYEAVVGTTLDLTNLLPARFSSAIWPATTTRSPSKISRDWHLVCRSTTPSPNSPRSAPMLHAVEEGFGTTPNPRETSTLRVGIDHELLRNVTLSALAQYEMDNYQNTDQEDDFYLVQASATYNINRNFYLRGTYSYTMRDSNQTGDNYDRNLFLLRVGAQL